MRTKAEGCAECECHDFTIEFASQGSAPSNYGATDELKNARKYNLNK